jgi:hypothetical protein
MCEQDVTGYGSDPRPSGCGSSATTAVQVALLYSLAALHVLLMSLWPVTAVGQPLLFAACLSTGQAQQTQLQEQQQEAKKEG